MLHYLRRLNIENNDLCGIIPTYAMWNKIVMLLHITITDYQHMCCAWIPWKYKSKRVSKYFVGIKKRVHNQYETKPPTTLPPLEFIKTFNQIMYTAKDVVWTGRKYAPIDLEHNIHMYNV